VLEVADGVLQTETAALLASPVFRNAVGGVIFAACDAMGAVAGYNWLKDRDLPVIGISGVLTSSPLQCQESKRETGLPVWSREELARAKSAMKILTTVRPHGMDAADALPGTIERRQGRIPNRR